MPIYDFKCQECGTVSEILYRSLDSQANHCPSCGSESMEKLFSASYTVRREASAPGATCCGKVERCETPPCSTDDGCRRG
ncbi:zinc ribbon domain-containing protein [Chloroflexota bacterium]